MESEEFDVQVTKDFPSTAETVPSSVTTTSESRLTIDEAVSAGGCFTSIAASSCTASLSPSSLPHVTLPSDLERHRRLRLWYGMSAMHLVPDIVVEHVSSSSFADSADIRHAASPLWHSLSPPFSSSIHPSAQPTSGRQVRALSDSSVCELEKSLVCAPEDLFVNRCQSSFSSHAVKSCPSSSMTTSGSILPSDTSSVYTRRRASEHSSELPNIVPMLWQLGSRHDQTSSRYSGPDRSPKAYWLGRHSDSNLANGQGWNSGLRLEPYPVRSHSTGDAHSAAVGPPPLERISCTLTREEARETALPYAHSEPLSSPRHLWQQLQYLAPRRLQSEKRSTEAKKFFSEGSEPKSFLEVELPLSSGRSLSEQGSERVDRYWLDQTSEMPTEFSGKQSESESLPSHQGASVGKDSIELKSSVPGEISVGHERSEGLMEKRLKLKKYLQTRYQMSLHQVCQSSDTDDVFADRHSSQDLSVLHTLPQPEDLSKRMKSGPEDEIESVVHDFSRRSKPSSEFQEEKLTTSPPMSQGFCAHTAESSQILHTSETVSIKPEPMSPGIVPSGTSVFVFPPALPPYHHDLGTSSPADWYRTLSQTGSPVPSPVTTRVENYPWLTSSRRIERFSSPGKESPACSTGSLQHGVPSALGTSGARWTRPMHSVLSSVRSSATCESQSLPPTPNFRDTSLTAVPSPLELWDETTASLQYSALSRSPSLGEPRRSRLGTAHVSHHASTSGDDLVMFTCPVCSVSFTSYRYLTDHMADHVSVSSHSEAGQDTESGAGGTGGSSKPVHLCPVCQRAFSRGDMLTRHVRLHTGIRPYECTLCSQVFSRSDHLTTHQRTHTGEKPYRCPICAYAAPRRDMVTRHARIHESLSSTSVRRGRRTASVSSPRDAGSVGRGARQVSTVTRQLAPLQRHKSDSSRFATHRRWSRASTEEEMPADVPFRHWSLASSIESTDSTAVPGPSAPVTCRAWSTTSAESFESYPGAAAHSSSVSSSLTAESPDVFSLQPRYFRWGAELHSTGDAAKVPADPPAVSVDVAGVMPALQKCSVASPSVDRGGDTSDTE